MGRARARPAPAVPLSSRIQVGLFAAAFALRLLHVLALSDNPFFDHPIIDAATYDEAARAIAAGRGHPDPVFWQPPGYSYFLALVYALSGGSFLAPRIVQAALGALSAVLTARIGAMALGRGVGLAAGIGAALHGTLIYFDGELLTPSLTLALQLLAVELGVRALKAPSPARWGGAGLLTGLAATVTATTLIWVPVFAAFARRHAVAVVVGALVAILPLSWRNAVRGGEAVLISTNAGINLYIGNNADYDRTVGVRPDLQWKRMVREPYRAGIRTRSGGSAYFTRKSVDFAVHDPAGFLRLQLKKVRLLFGGNEIPRNQAIYPFRADSPVLAVLLWKVPGLALPWGVLLPPALLGLVVAWRRAPLLAALLVAYAVTVLAFFITARYRLPLVPLGLIFAAAGVVWLAREAHGRRRAAALAGMAAVYAVANLGQGTMDRRMNADAEYSLGAGLALEGRPREARRWLMASLEQNPRYPQAWADLGVLDATEGRPLEAERNFRRALEIEPEDTVALVNLGILCQKSGRIEEARALLRRAVEIDPEDRDAARRLSDLGGP